MDFKQLHEQADSIIGRMPPIRKRRSLRLAGRILKYLGLTIIILFLLLIILLSAQFLNFTRIYNQVASGKANLEQAIIAVRRDDLSQASSLAKQSQNNFDSAIDDLNRIKTSLFLSNWPLLADQLNQAQSLLVSAQFLSRAVYEGTDFGLSLESLLGNNKKLNFTKFTPEEKRKVLGKIYESAPELNGIKADLDLAYLNLEQVSGSGFLYLFNDKLNQVKEQIGQAKLILENVVPLTQLIPALAGYGREAKFLVMLENSYELRPTGGFLGTYGVLKIKDGDIASFETEDIYHLDMPAQDKMNVEPPPPIKKYLNNKWYLRDANWSPDWPTSAKKIDWFYRLEKNLINPKDDISNFDGVIALTPKLVTDLLRITGPVMVEGQSYDENNFHDLLEYRVEKGYEQLGVSSWHRKAVIGPIVNEIKIKIFDLPPDKWSNVAYASVDNLAKKNLLLYLSDNQLEEIVAANGWAGEIKNYYGDYLMVVDANMGALKTDAVMARGMDYKVLEKTDGMFSQLTINYAHNGQTDWKTSIYKSYTRIYVPLGSKLINISEYSRDQIDTGNESGKTWFGFYLAVKPGEIKNITINYRLPSEINQAAGYGLYIQKQPGKELNRLSFDLNFKNDIKSYSPANLFMQKIGPTELKWEGDLSIDRNFNVNF